MQEQQTLRSEAKVEKPVQQTDRDHAGIYAHRPRDRMGGVFHVHRHFLPDPVCRGRGMECVRSVAGFLVEHEILHRQLSVVHLHRHDFYIVVHSVWHSRFAADVPRPRGPQGK